MRLKYFLPLFLGLLLPLLGFAQDKHIPEKPYPPKLYNNLSKQFPNFISAGEAASLERKLVAISDSGVAQIAVVVVDNFGGDEENSFATKLFNKWEIGYTKKNNGILILIKPTQEDGGRRVYINTGYGLEGAIPDGYAGRIIDDVITPRFKEGQNYKGIDDGVNAIYAAAQGDFKPVAPKKKSGGKSNNLIWILVVIFIIYFLSRGGGGRTFGRRVGHGGWYGGWGGGFGGFSGGGGGGGFGGGGFGGFGGGSSGGGGAGGSW